MPRGFEARATPGPSASVAHLGVLDQAKSPPGRAGSEAEVDVFKIEFKALVEASELIPASEVEGHRCAADSLDFARRAAELSCPAAKKRDRDSSLLDAVAFPVKDQRRDDADRLVGVVHRSAHPTQCPWEKNEVVVAQDSCLVACGPRRCQPKVGTSSEAGTAFSRNTDAGASSFFADDEERCVFVEGVHQSG